MAQRKSRPAHPTDLNDTAQRVRDKMRRLKDLAAKLEKQTARPPSLDSAAEIAAPAEIIDLDSAEELQLAPAARARTEIVGELVAYGYSEEELSRFVVPKRTLARRRSGNELLTVEETDKALRLKRIASLAEQVFGNRTKAHRWLRKPKRSLAGDTPLAYLASEHGARIVEEMLGRIEHGIYA
jgi:putative toxin-antitoxin system antitoxin component (TIGR02293 family)